MRLKAMVRALSSGIFITMLSAHSMTWAQTSPRQIEVTAKRYTFEPGEITLKRGEPVLIVIKSRDAAHGLRFREFNAEGNVRADGTSKIQLTPARTGDFAGDCAVLCDSGRGARIVDRHQET